MAGFDPSADADDRTHGAQQLSFFNDDYDSWCYLPLLGVPERRSLGDLISRAPVAY